MADNHNPPTAEEVGQMFVSRYYRCVVNRPQDVHRFYTESATLSSAEESVQNVELISGQQRIEAKLASLNYDRPNFQIISIDCQSANNAINILVVGVLRTGGSHERKFSQMFCLVKGAAGGGAYYVQNDAVRFHADEGKAAAAPAAAPAPAHVETAAPAHKEHKKDHKAEHHEHKAAEPKAEHKEHVAAEHKAEHKEPAAPKEPKNRKQQQHQENAKAAPAAAPAPAPEVKEAVPAGPPSSYAAAIKINSGKAAAPAKPAAKPAPAAAAPAPSAAAPAPAGPSLGIPAGGNVQLYVAPLNNTDTAVDELRAIFGKFGDVKDISTRANKQNEGQFYAFVEFTSRDGLERALAAHDKKALTLHGTALSVQERQAQTPAGAKGPRRGGAAAGGPGRGDGAGSRSPRGRGDGAGRGRGRGAAPGGKKETVNDADGFTTVSNRKHKADQ